MSTRSDRLRSTGVAVIADGDAVERQDRRRDLRRFGEGEAGRRVLDDDVDHRQLGDRLQPRLRLPRLARLVAEAVDEGLHVRLLRRDPFRRRRLLHRALGADAHELVVAAGRQA